MDSNIAAPPESGTTARYRRHSRRHRRLQIHTCDAASESRYVHNRGRYTQRIRIDQQRRALRPRPSPPHTPACSAAPSPGSNPCLTRQPLHTPTKHPAESPSVSTRTIRCGSCSSPGTSTIASSASRTAASSSAETAGDRHRLRQLVRQRIEIQQQHSHRCIGNHQRFKSEARENWASPQHLPALCASPRPRPRGPRHFPPARPRRQPPRMASVTRATADSGAAAVSARAATTPCGEISQARRRPGFRRVGEEGS